MTTNTSWRICSENGEKDSKGNQRTYAEFSTHIKIEQREVDGMTRCVGNLVTVLLHITSTSSGSRTFSSLGTLSSRATLAPT